MNTAQSRIDRSVNFQPHDQKDAFMNTNSIRLKLEEFKASLAARLAAEFARVEARLVHQAVNEAYALASTTFAPLLILPELAEEKVRQVAAWSDRQQAMLAPRALALAA